MLKIMLKKRPTTMVIGKLNETSRKWDNYKFVSILNIVVVDDDGNIVKTFDPIYSEQMTKKEFKEFDAVDFKNRKLKACFNEIKDSVSEELVIKKLDIHYSDPQFLRPFEVFFPSDGVYYIGEYCTYDSNDLAKDFVEAAERKEIDAIIINRDE